MGDDVHVIFSDDSIIVVNKPGGLLAVPGRGPDKQDCVVNRARKLFADLPEQPAVHRLDMFTSGLMVLARNHEAHRELSHQFQHRLVTKRYMALVEGSVTPDSGTMDLAFRLDPDNRPYQIYDPINGKQGITLWRKLSDEKPGARIEFTPLTGRTHQLRLHAAHPSGLNAPIVGDALYGNKRDDLKMFLHAMYLAFNHPLLAKQIEFSAAVPF